MRRESLFKKGELVEIYTWRNRDSVPKVGVIIEEVHDASVEGFSRYDVLIDDKVVTCRRDMIQKSRSTQ